MTPELKVLILAALWHMLQLVFYAVPANMELGTGKTLSPRDPYRLKKPLMEQVSVPTGRLARAYNNHNEALLLFAIAAIAVTLSGASSGYTATLAWISLAARIAYVPAYALGWVPWRSIIFGLGWLATGLLLLAALFAPSSV